MTVETHVEQALDRVRDEQVATEGKQTAYSRFIREVEKTSVETPTDHQGTLQTTTGPVTTIHSTGSNGSTGCKRIRECFADTVCPCSTVDVEDHETSLETIAAELSDRIAVALAPQNATAGFTTSLKQSVLSEVTDRRYELRAMERALDREEAALVEAKDQLDGIIQWIIEENETALSRLDFAALRARHDRLDEFRGRCETIAQERQSLLHATTSAEAQVGIAQQELVKHLYVSFPVVYPVLSTVVHVEQVCAHCQRTIRDHLVRRV